MTILEDFWVSINHAHLLILYMYIECVTCYMYMVTCYCTCMRAINVIFNCVF